MLSFHSGMDDEVKIRRGSDPPSMLSSSSTASFTIARGDSDRSMRGHHDLHHQTIQDFDSTIRKFREQQKRRKSSVFTETLHAFAVIDDIVDMNRFSLKFREVAMENKYERYSARTKVRGTQEQDPSVFGCVL